MALPSLAALAPAGAPAAPAATPRAMNLSELPMELLAKTLSLVDGDPCEDDFLELCKKDELFEQVCRDDGFWMALCERQGWDLPERTTGWHDKTGMTWRQQFFKWCGLRFGPYEPTEYERIFRRKWRPIYDAENKTGRFKLRRTLEMLVEETDGTGVLPETPPKLLRRSTVSKVRKAKEVRKYGPVGSWDVSRVTDMKGMFTISDVKYSSGLPRTSSAPASMEYFNADISGWNVSNVTDMSNMFVMARAFNNGAPSGESTKPLKWNTSEVTNMSNMFHLADAFNQDIGGWNVSKVDSMSGMFQDASVFNQNIGKWNVSSVKKMDGMFFMASSFNQDISGWNVSKVETMAEMFYEATEFDQNLSEWFKKNKNKNLNRADMFERSGMSRENLSLTTTLWPLLFGDYTQPPSEEDVVDALSSFFSELEGAS